MRDVRCGRRRLGYLRLTYDALWIRYDPALVRRSPAPATASALPLVLRPHSPKRATARAFCWSSVGCLGFLLSLLETLEGLSAVSTVHMDESRDLLATRGRLWPVS